MAKESQFKGYYISPTFPEVAVNKKGEVVRLKDCHIKSNTIEGKPFAKVGDKTYGSLTIKNYRFVRTYNAKAKKRMKVYVHRIVAEAFLGKEPNGKPYVNHKDKNTENNAADNLEWSSVSENTKHGLESYDYLNW